MANSLKLPSLLLIKQVTEYCEQSNVTKQLFVCICWHQIRIPINQQILLPLPRCDTNRLVDKHKAGAENIYGVKLLALFVSQTVSLQCTIFPTAQIWSSLSKRVRKFTLKSVIGQAPVLKNSLSVLILHRNRLGCLSLSVTSTLVYYRNFLKCSLLVDSTLRVDSQSCQQT